MKKLKRIRYVFRTLYPVAFRYKPFYLVLEFVDFLLGILAPFIQIIVPPLVIDELLGEKNLQTLGMYVALVVLGTMGIAWIRRIISEQMDIYRILLEQKYHEAMVTCAMEMEYSFLERSEVLDEMQIAMEGMGWYSGGIVGITTSVKGIVTSFIVVIGTLSIVLIYAPWLALVLAIICTLNSILQAKEHAIQMKYYHELASLNRRSDYVFSELSDVVSGKDIRIYQGQKLIMEKVEHYAGEIGRGFGRQAKETIMLKQSSNVVQSISQCITYLYLGVLALLGSISMGNFVMLLSAFSQFSAQLGSLMEVSQELFIKCCYAEDYGFFLEKYGRKAKSKTLLKKLPEHPSILEFRNVSFRYPNSEEYVLKDFTYQYSLSERISIVGENGAGKSTFIKLICRLYSVEEGDILLDGVSIYEYELEEYQKLFSVVFQDFKLFEQSIAENITMSRNQELGATSIENMKKMELLDKIEQLPKGWNTQMFRSFDENGFVPSGGEQQKLALIRALHKESAIIILDEPTSALDPEMEENIYQLFDQFTKQKPILFVSHRLASCKLCDKVIVFDKGKIVEEGSHTELMKKESGKYKELYQTQAQFFYHI